ncbi:MAG: TonB-dependent receptor [Bacteroidales bacterium]|nr:TonB-dependent receptor [Bacteroidales bacterium]
MNKICIHKTPIYFKRWSRHKYAVFNSLRKIINISVISLSCSFLTIIYSKAQSNDTILKTLDLDEVIIVTDNPIETQNIQSILLQTSVNKKEIEQSPVQSLNELLDQFQSLDIRQRGSLGTQADISYRGGSFDQTLVLLNGINFTDPQTGHYTLNLPLSPDYIQKIEIYKNTIAYLFGTSAFSGLINIITEPAKEKNINVHFMTGMYGLYKIDFNSTVQTKNFRHLFAFENSHSNGYIENTDFSIVQAFYHSIGEFKKGNIEFQSGFIMKDYGANGFYSLKYPNQHEKTETFISSIKFISNKKINIFPSLYYRFNKDCFELIKGQDPKKNNYHFNQIIGINILHFFNSRLGKTSFHADFRLEDIKSNTLGTILKNPIRLKTPEIYYTHALTRSNCGFSASHNYTKNNFSSEFSILLQHFSSIKKRYYLLPAINISYYFKELKTDLHEIGGKIYLTASNSVRPPTFTELYYKTGDVIGNPFLKPEQAYTIEMGGEMEFSYLNKKPFIIFDAAIFYRKGLDLIDFIKYKGEASWHSINHTTISFTGIEAKINLLPQNIQKNVFIELFNISYTYLYSEKQENINYISRYTLDHLEHQLSMTLVHAIYKELKISYHLSYNKRKGQYISYQNSLSGELKKYPAYCLLDIRLQYTYQYFTFYIEASNILNQTYYDFGDLEQAGIWFKGGIKCSIR